MKAECWCYYVRLTAEDQHVQDVALTASIRKTRHHHHQQQQQRDFGQFAGSGKTTPCLQVGCCGSVIKCCANGIYCWLCEVHTRHRHIDTCMWPRLRQAIKPTLSLVTTQHCLPLFYIYHLQDHRRKAQPFKNTTDESKLCLCSNPPSLHR